MSFLKSIALQKLNLRHDDCLHTIYGDMVAENDENSDKLIEFFLHTNPDQAYMFDLLNKLTESTDCLSRFSGEEKAYLLTFLFVCMRKDEPCYSEGVRLLAAIIYSKILCEVQTRELFYKEVVLKRCVGLAINPTQKPKLKLILLNALGEILTADIKEATELITYAIHSAFTVNIIRFSNKVYKKFDDTDLVGSCFQNIIGLIEAFSTDNRCETVMSSIESLFCQFRPALYIPNAPSNHVNALGTLRHFIKYLINNHFSEYQKEMFPLAFIETWSYDDFKYFDEAALLLNCLPQEMYNEIIRNMGLCLMSASHENSHVNVLNLLQSIFSNLPTFCDDRKLGVLYEVAISYIVFSCHDASKCSKQAIETLSKICLLQNSHVRSILTTYANNPQLKPVPVDLLLRYLLYSTKTKWITGQMAVQVINIICVLTCCMNDIKISLIYELIYALCWDTTPRTLLANRNVLEELFLKLKTQREPVIPRLIMNIFIKMAKHGDSDSREFIKYLYESMIKPKQIRSIMYTEEHYISSVLEDEENANILFQKCQIYQLIKREHLEYAVRMMNFHRLYHLKLLYYLAKYYKYNEVAQISQFILANFQPLVVSGNFKYVLLVYNVVLDNKRNFTENELSEIEAIYTNLVDSVNRQHGRLENLHNICLTLRKSQAILQIDSGTDFIRMNNKSLNLLETCILSDNKDASILYSGAETILLSKQLPSDSCINKITELTTHENLLNVKLTEPSLWFPLFHLAEVLALVRKADYLDQVLILIKYSMQCQQYDHTHRMFMLKVLHNLATEITEDFEPLIQYSLKEIHKGNLPLRKLASIFLEDMIEKDYLKFNSHQFYYFVSLMNIPESRIHMQDLLSKRFIHNQHKDIAKYFVSFIMFTNLFEHPNYDMSDELKETLINTKASFTDLDGVYKFFFTCLPLKYKINVMMEANEILLDYTKNRIRHNDDSIKLVDDLLYIYQMSSYAENVSTTEIFKKACRIITQDVQKKKVVENDMSVNLDCSKQIIKILHTLLVLFLFNEEKYKISLLRKKLFIVIMHWIVAYKVYIVGHINKEGAEDLIRQLTKLHKYYNTYKDVLREEIEF